MITGNNVLAYIFMRSDSNEEEDTLFNRHFSIVFIKY